MIPAPGVHGNQNDSPMTVVAYDGWEVDSKSDAGCDATPVSKVTPTNDSTKGATRWMFHFARKTGTEMEHVTSGDENSYTVYTLPVSKFFFWPRPPPLAHRVFFPNDS